MLAQSPARRTVEARALQRDKWLVAATQIPLHGRIILRTQLAQQRAQQGGRIGHDDRQTDRSALAEQVHDVLDAHDAHLGWSGHRAPSAKASPAAQSARSASNSRPCRSRNAELRCQTMRADSEPPGKGRAAFPATRNAKQHSARSRSAAISAGCAISRSTHADSEPETIGWAERSDAPRPGDAPICRVADVDQATARRSARVTSALRCGGMREAIMCSAIGSPTGD